MTRPSSNRRLRRIWLALGTTAVVTLLLSVLVVSLQAARDTDLGDARAAVTTDALAAPADADPPRLRFVDVTEESGITSLPLLERRRLLPEDTGSGLAWGDVDGDGDLDLYVAGIRGGRLWRHEAPTAESGPLFLDATAAAGLDDPEAHGMGASFADYDDDGDLDLYLTCFGPNRLYRNRGDGSFEEVARLAGVDDPSWSTGAAWGDFDRDGDLDLYVVNYLAYDLASLGADVEMAPEWEEVPFSLNPNAFDPAANRLYRNRGDSSFEEVALELGVLDPDGRGLEAVFVDLDGDGWLDLYVNNDVSPNALFHNRGASLGEAMFEDWSARTGSADPRGSMGLCVADLGGDPGHEAASDGRPDLFITHWVAQENALYQNVERAGSFELRDRTRVLGLGEVSLEYVGWGCAAVDLDLDGRLDLVTVNGSTLERRDDPRLLRSEPIFLFWNDGRRFFDLAAAAGGPLAQLHDARGLAAADWDGDGDVDLAVARNRQGPLLLRNDSERRGESLTLRLEGPEALRHGARVEVESGDRLQTRWYLTDGSFLSGHAPDLIFGLGESTSVSSIRVHWTDGRESTVHDVPPGLLVLAPDP